MSKFVTASEAIAKLKISKRTLYAYVSRGLIRSHRGVGDSRQRLYAKADVETLAHRKKHGRTPAAVARTTLNWGLPVLESSISLIDRGSLYYRGTDALTLARDGATLEDIASLLWEMKALRFRATRFYGEPLKAASPIHRCISYLSCGPESAAQGETHVLQSVAAGIMGQGPSAEPLHIQLARRWGVTGNAIEGIRIGLVLSADHELNASTFTVRCVASTGASLALSVCAGLSALSGPLHGGLTDMTVELLQSVRGARYAAALQRYAHIPGFGHGLYPDGDPRARAILGFLNYKPANALVKAAAQLDAPPPTLDMGLAALEVGLQLPRHAGLSMFALGRTVGWIAHALEQRRTGALIRPRARYTGIMPKAAAA